MKKFFTLCSVALLAASAFADNMALKVTTPEAKANAWDSQVFINFPAPVEAGKAYTLLLDVKADKDLAPKMGDYGWEAIQPIVQDANSDNKDQWGGPADLQYLAHFTVTTEWVKDVKDCDGNDIVTDGTFPYSRLLLNLGNLDGAIYVDNVRMVDADGVEAFCITFDTPEEQALVENGWMNLPKEFVAVEGGSSEEPSGEVMDLANAYFWNGGSLEGNVATFVNAWDGLAWWLDAKEGVTKIVVEYEEPTTILTQLLCLYNDVDNQSAQAPAGSTSLSIDLTPGSMSQFAIQNEEPGSIVIKSVTLYSEASSINTVKAEDNAVVIYNLNGQKTNAAKGLQIRNGKVILVK